MIKQGCQGYNVLCKERCAHTQEQEAERDLPERDPSRDPPRA